MSSCSYPGATAHRARSVRAESGVQVGEQQGPGDAARGGCVHAVTAATVSPGTFQFVPCTGQEGGGTAVEGRG